MLTRGLPAEERFSLTDQIRRSSRSVGANIVEAWRKRRYEAAFVSKLSDADAEGAETQYWLEQAVACGYFTPEVARPLYREYDEILAMLVAMMTKPEKWTLPGHPTKRGA
ncbi:MAG: four helix bundle protein [Phycisphaerales bacterium]